MGIKDLNTYLKKTTPECLERVHMSTLSGKKVAIDTSIYFYKFLYKNPRFIESFLEQIYKLIKCGITPVYVFDGKPPQEKLNELQYRKGKKDEMKDKINEITQKLENMKEEETKKLQQIQKIIDESQEKGIPLDLSNFEFIEDSEKNQLEEQMGKLQKKLIYVTWKHKEELKYFLNMLHIPYIQAECEADSICAELSRRNIVDCVMSDDMDLLVDGTKILLRDFNVNSYMILKYERKNILETLKLTNEQWIDFCILCGCDYTKRIYGMGPFKCIQFIRTEKNIETVLEKYVGPNKKYKFPSEEYKFKEARYLFTHSPFYKEEYNTCFEIPNNNENQYEMLMMYLSEATNYSEMMVHNRVTTILNHKIV